MKNKIKEICQNEKNIFKRRDKLKELKIKPEEWYKLPIKSKFAFIVGTKCNDCRWGIHHCCKEIKEANNFKVDEQGYIHIVCEDFEWW